MTLLTGHFIVLLQKYTLSKNDIETSLRKFYVQFHTPKPVTYKVLNLSMYYVHFYTMSFLYTFVYSALKPRNVAF